MIIGPCSSKLASPQESDYVAERCQTLIDRKYERGLSPRESEELDGLKAALDEMDEPYYEAIINRLRRLVEERES